jgi:hypothetical protein
MIIRQEVAVAIEKYEALSGEVLNLSGLSRAESKYLEQLSADAQRSVDYFELLRRVKGRDALPLRGGPLTPAIATSAFYRAAHDIVDRVGIEQGYLLAPDVAASARATNGTGDLLSLTEAADLIGISRPAAHQALKEERLRGRQVGNAWVIASADALAFKKARDRPSQVSSPARLKRG